ncbi:MAG: hypothetical protein PHN59_01745 [Candidatus Omnitrophica bacterium]|nr:hypothetical protein [Candidatus Omnitrophota bacterium]
MENKEKLIETLQSAVDTENTLHFCYSYLVSLIHNSGARQNFTLLSQSAKLNQEFLINLLKGLEVEEFLPEHKCKFCNIKAESFSLQGAISLGIEILDLQIKLYRDLALMDINAHEKARLRAILEDKINHREILKKESKFAVKEDEKLNFIESYCIPGIIAKLWE